ncbi:hypothetical protein Tcan_03765 [Toxocara canis]|uniref:Uncharacterized protein n=1 Tax=Toxocara canis TaxID=6265 RepID=A0A0B2UKL0_TOXCA|nr:hypothetical protein Tcan_03765 [Toxocara canis]
MKSVTMRLLFVIAIASMVAPIVSGQAIALDDADSEGVEDVDRDLLHRRRAFMRAKGDRLRDELHDSPDFGEDETGNTIADAFDQDTVDERSTPSMSAESEHSDEINAEKEGRHGSFKGA